MLGLGAYAGGSSAGSEDEGAGVGASGAARDRTDADTNPAGAPSSSESKDGDDSDVDDPDASPRDQVLARAEALTARARAARAAGPSSVPPGVFVPDALSALDAAATTPAFLDPAATRVAARLGGLRTVEPLAPTEPPPPRAPARGELGSGSR